MRRSFLLLLLVACCAVAHGQVVYEVWKGTVKFHSEAPKEFISAESKLIRGAMDLQKRTFAFKIGISSFQGFNSPLQREHFHESYMETVLFPDATYMGKIIEDADISKPGTYNVRTKGKLRIHGVERERIINAIITNRNGSITITANFLVPLADHNIKIPRVVSDNLAPEVSVSVNALLQAR